MLRTHLTYGVLLCIPFCYEHFSITLKAIIISNACFCWIHIILCFFFLRKKKMPKQTFFDRNLAEGSCL